MVPLTTNKELLTYAEKEEQLTSYANTPAI
jgi:hypothetical protein